MTSCGLKLVSSLECQQIDELEEGERWEPSSCAARECMCTALEKPGANWVVIGRISSQWRTSAKAFRICSLHRRCVLGTAFCLLKSWLGKVLLVHLWQLEGYNVCYLKKGY